MWAERRLSGPSADDRQAPYAAAESIPLIKSPSLRVPKKVRLKRLCCSDSQYLRIRWNCHRIYTLYLTLWHLTWVPALSLPDGCWISSSSSTLSLWSRMSSPSSRRGEARSQHILRREKNIWGSVSWRRKGGRRKPSDELLPASIPLQS